jgi:hypothetical protein
MVSNYDQFMAALRAERQRELRQTAAGGMQQRHLPSPDTRLVPLPGPKEMVVGFLARPSWLPQLESTGYLFTPELRTELAREERLDKVNQSLFGQKQKITKEQLITRRALRRLNHTDSVK